MEYPDLHSALEWAANNWHVFLSAGALVAVLAWSWARTGSTHFITYRLWKFINGSRETRHDGIREYLDNRDALMRFRAETGIRRASTPARVEKLIWWMNEHDVAPESVRACGPYFDFKEVGLKKKIPGPKRQFVAVLFLVLALYAAVFGVMALVYAPSYVQSTLTRHWYGVTGNDAHRTHFSRNGPRFSADDCADKVKIAKVTDYPLEDVSALCDLLHGDEGARFLRRARIEQNVLIAPVTCVAIFYFFLSWLVIRGMSGAVRLERELKK